MKNKNPQQRRKGMKNECSSIAGWEDIELIKCKIENKNNVNLSAKTHAKSPK